jgi:2-polyprenyl-3-methyl-5-hydroxy-6-metoxy-1,4-benzoquinol methylase
MNWATRTFDTPEWMDDEGVDPGQLEAALRYIRAVNRRLGYTRATVRAILSKGVRAPADLSVLDVATGSADVPVALRGAAARRGVALSVTGLDLHAATLAHADRFTGGAVPLVRGDAVALPYADGAFDVVTSSMFLHHLPDELVVRALKEMGRVARSRVVVADLVRGRRALAWITLFTLGRGEMIRHDARVSVRQAFRLSEIERLANAAGLRGIAVRRVFGHRFVLTATATPRTSSPCR